MKCKLLAWVMLGSLTAFGQGAKGGEERLIGSIQGPDLFREYCAVCHGADAKGKGPLADSLKKPASDLTRIAARNKGTFPKARITGIVSGEQPVLKGHGTHAMPVWGPVFSQVTRDEDLGHVRIDNVVRYLESLQGK